MRSIEESMLIFALRYVLGRTTAAPSMYVNHITEKWNEISRETRERIHKEIREAIRLGNAGHQCDIDEWCNVLKLDVVA